MLLDRKAFPAWIVGLTLVMTGAPVQAAHLSGGADLGYAASSGNSRTSNLDTKLRLKYKTGPWTHKLKLGAISSSKSGQTTAERYTGSGKSEYDFSPHNYVFGQIQYIKDLFAGIRQNISETVGYGRRLLDSKSQHLDAEIGAGFSQTQEQKPSLARHSDVIGQLGLDYEYRISKTSRFKQSLSMQSGRTNTFLESVTGLRVAINGNLGVQLSYTVDHNTTVPTGLAKTDTYTSVALSYQFGEGS
jgi:putative salt-induced outer membrane protein